MTMNSIDKFIENNLSEKRRKHIEGVRATAVKLAKKYGEDPKKAEMAALYHDMCRGMDQKQLNKYVKKFNLPKRYLDNGNLSHGKIAAELMMREYKISDEDLLNAVRYHTTGRAGMSLLEKIIFLADSMEPGRDYQGVEELRKLAKKDIDKAILYSLDRTISYVKDRKVFLDKDTLEAREWLAKKEKVHE